MTSDDSFLKDVKPPSQGHVPFGDERKGMIKGIENVASPGLPSLKDMLFVENLSA